MSGPIIVIERPELVPVTTSTKIAKHSQLDELYAAYAPAVRRFSQDMEALHGQYMELTGPVIHDIAERVSQGRVVVLDDFVETMHLRSGWIRQQAQIIERAFQRQHRAACNLARLA